MSVKKKNRSLGHLESLDFWIARKLSTETSFTRTQSPVVDSSKSKSSFKLVNETGRVALVSEVVRSVIVDLTPLDQPRVRPDERDWDPVGSNSVTSVTSFLRNPRVPKSRDARQGYAV